MKRLLLTALLLASPLVQAESMPQFDENDPEITIRHSEGSTFYEYRINGELREIKVIPSKGKPYYLVPAEGETFNRADQSTLLIPKWVLFRW